MSERLKWLEDSRGKYLFIDFSKLEDASALGLMLEFHELIQKEPLESVSFFADVTGINLSTNSLSNFRKISKDSQKYIYRSAMIGMSAFGKTFFPIYRSITKTKIYVFNTKEESLNYLFSVKAKV